MLIDQELSLFYMGTKEEMKMHFCFPFSSPFPHLQLLKLASLELEQINSCRIGLRIDKNLIRRKTVWFFHDYEACIHKTIEIKKNLCLKIDKQ